MKRHSALLECVPNFSVGPDDKTLHAIEASFQSVKGVFVLDIHTDASHNRSVFTVVGEPLPLQEAMFEAVRTAIDRIDLRQHVGQHPRVGAADVIPFVAIPPTPRSVAITAAREFAEWTANALDLPIYLYEWATLGEKIRSLPTIRGRGFEWLNTALKGGKASPPDFGPSRLHPTAGASVVGARDFLVAFNVNLDTPSVPVAEQIARNIRAASGGHPGIRSLGLRVDGRAQVSMNLFDLHAVTVHEAYGLVETLAARQDVAIYSSEIVGLAPRAALAGFSAAESKLSEPMEQHILEARIESVTRANATTKT